jgi:GcrA cell cycle regulator
MTEIARKIGVGKNHVAGKAHRLGMPGRPSPIKRGVEIPVHE